MKALHEARCGGLNCRIGRALARDVNGHPHPAVHLTGEQMQRLPEYSASISTGKVIGERWRRRMDHAGTHWLVCGYEELSLEDQIKWPGQIAIVYFVPIVDDGAPGEWKEVR